MRIVGPNCLGVMSPLTGLNATFAAGMALPGNVAFLSQSGALLTAILDWSLSEQVGFSAFVSLGTMLDVGWGDLIDYLGNDPRTHAIVIYMESIGDARAFLSAAREVALTKPIIVIKAGRSEAAAAPRPRTPEPSPVRTRCWTRPFAAAACCGSPTSPTSSTWPMCSASSPGPRGPRLAMVTNAGGPGVLATDALIAAGGELAPLESRDAGAPQRRASRRLESRESHRRPG